MKNLFVLVLMTVVAVGASTAEAKKKKNTERAPSGAELKYCGTWIHGAHSYADNYDHFKPTTLLGTVKDNKFNVQILARAFGGQWGVIKDVAHGECICMKGERDGEFMKSVVSVWECNGGPQRFAKESDDFDSFKPLHEVHSNGKAYSECQDPAEQEQEYKGRKICVNEQGDYYYIAD